MSKGYIIFTLVTFTTIILFILSKFENQNSSSLLLLIGQLSGLLLITFTSFNFFLASRTYLIEKLFNGLDKVYKLHKLLGKSILFLIFLHPLTLYLNSKPFLSLSDFFVINLNNPSYMYGILAFYTLLILMFITLFVNISYKLWKTTHQYMGLVIIFGGVHSMLIGSDISNFFALRVWVLTLLTFALSFFVYKRYLYYLLKKKNNYRVLKVDNDKEYSIIEVEPVKKNEDIKFRPGQFAFISIDSEKDEHPFSVWNIEANNLKIGFKVIGDFTNKLSKLKSGSIISIHGPFGVFGNDINFTSNVVFISAGIGITPFLLLLKNLDSKINLTYINTMHSTDSKIFINEIEKELKTRNNTKYINLFSDTGQRTNFDFLQKNIDIKKDSKFYICGPLPFMKTVSKYLSLLGVKKSKIAFEDFSLK